MSIHYQCDCGSNIVMPGGSGGKRARCKTCGSVFIVPQATAVIAHVPRQPDKEPKPGLLRRLYEGVPPDDDPSQDDAPVVWTGGTGFWTDLISSFWFFKTPANLITLLAIAFVHFWMILLDYGGMFGFIGKIILSGYLCAFYMSTILETASGEDHLPTVWISNIWDDLFMPLLQFIGTFLWVLLPAGALALGTAYANGEVPWQWVAVLAVIGLLHWPAVILAVAIGGGFSGLWPHVVFRTAMAAPIAYLAVCIAVMISYGLMFLPETEYVQSAVGNLHPAATWGIPLIGTVVTAYAMIVTMRVIGLFYRHYKTRFPWTAE